MMADSELGLASGRDRRSNAGARMSRLLDAEDDDDFYKTTYGGFTEVGVAALFMQETFRKKISFISASILGIKCSFNFVNV